VSVPVDLAALEAEIGRFGAVAFLVTAGVGRPHVVSVRVALAGAALTMAAGRTSRRNLAASPSATLLWPGAPGAEYCLLVDGTARVDDDAEVVTVEPTGAILHRLADASADLPSCVPVDGAPDVESP
jgi:hypothetical protein